MTSPTISAVQAANPAAPHPRPLPHIVLHEHLDGGLRPSTLLELLDARGIAAPADDVPTLERWFDARAHAGSLVEYLRGFDLTVAAMASPEALRRVAFEAAEDARADGAVLAEFRLAPLLFEPLGLSGDAVVEAVVDGLAASELGSRRACGLIVCGMRQEPPEAVDRAVALALRWQGRGVVGFDLAGPERGFPPGLHAVALTRVRQAGLPMTLHAGEADAGERVLEAGRVGARRIGHGVRLVDLLRGPEAAAVLDEVHRLGLHLEVCPTSNVQTGAAVSVAEHPITALWQAGVPLSIHPDNRLMSRVRQSDELAVVRRCTPLGDADLLAMAVLAARASFLEPGARQAAERAVVEDARRHGQAAALSQALARLGVA